MALVERKSPRFFYGYFIVLVNFFIMLVMWGSMYTFGVFFKPLQAEFGWTRAMTAGAYSMYQILHGLLHMGAGRLTDRFGPRRVITVCGLFLGIGYFLMSQVDNIWELYLFYGVIISIGMAGSWIPSLSTVARWFTKRRSAMTGVTVSGVGLGSVVMAPLAAYLITTYDWRTSYIAVSVIAAAVSVLAAQFLKRDPEQIGQSPYGEGELEKETLNLSPPGFSFGEVIRTWRFWILWAGLFCYGFGSFTVLIHIVPHATDLGFSAASAASLLATIGIVSSASRIIIGWIADKIGNRPALIGCFSIGLVVFLWLTVAEEAWMLFLCAVIFGIAYSGLSTLESPLVADLFGMRSHGIILGAVAFGVTSGGAVGPALAGGIFDITGNYTIAFLICAALAAVGITLLLLVKPLGRKGGDNDSGRSA